MDIGSQCYMQAKVPDASRIIVEVSCCAGSFSDSGPTHPSDLHDFGSDSYVLHDKSEVTIL